MRFAAFFIHMAHARPAPARQIDGKAVLSPVGGRAPVCGITIAGPAAVAVLRRESYGIAEYRHLVHEHKRGRPASRPRRVGGLGRLAPAR